VRSALATLTPDQRRVLELAYYGGWAQTEIAEHFDMPLGMVKGRTRPGLEKLSSDLHRWCDPRFLGSVRYRPEIQADRYELGFRHLGEWIMHDAIGFVDDPNADITAPG